MNGKNIDAWKVFSNNSPLTLQELKSKIENRTPTEAARLRALYELNDNWVAATGTGDLTKKEMIDALKPTSAFYKTKSALERALIDQVFVYWYQTFGAGTLPKKEVLSRISALQPTAAELVSAMKLLESHWSQAIGSSWGLTPKELRVATYPTSAFNKKLTPAQAKSFALAAEYWLQHPVSFFGADKSLTLDELREKISPPPINFPTDAEWMAL